MESYEKRIKIDNYLLGVKYTKEGFEEAAQILGNIQAAVENRDWQDAVTWHKQLATVMKKLEFLKEEFSATVIRQEDFQ